MKQLRESRKWTKTDAASKLNKTLSTYANWEYGLREPDSEHLKKSLIYMKYLLIIY